jgi:hypothetical protein
MEFEAKFCTSGKHKQRFDEWPNEKGPSKHAVDGIVGVEETASSKGEARGEKYQ